MITPRFEVSQDSKFVYVNIKAPHIKASLIQFDVADDTFVFTLPPYYLRLRFPAFVIEDDEMTSEYDLSSSTVKCRVAKLHEGEHFEDLDMISKLLATKREKEALKNPQKPIIQELDSPCDSISREMQDPDFDWEIEQSLPEDQKDSVTYGFNNQYSERVGLSIHTGNEINELADPEHETAYSKLKLLRETTRDQFDADHYLADLHDDGTITEILNFIMPAKLKASPEEKDRIARLGTREYLVSDQKAVYLGLVPLIYGWAYDFRTNFGEATVESSWNIGKLCPSMCFLYSGYRNVSDVMRDCTARAVSRPLYRHWELAMQVWKDVIILFRAGKQTLLAIFGKLLQIFENDLHFVYRQILIEDYTVWIQNSSIKVLESISRELEKSLPQLRKDCLYLPLVEAEKGQPSVEADRDNDSDDSDDSDVMDDVRK